MRTSIAFVLATLSLVPATALADEDAKQPSKDTSSAPSGSNPEATSPNAYVPPQSVAYEGGKIPFGSSIEKRPNLAFVVTGTTILGTAYAASLITAVAMCGPGMECSKGAGWLYLPIVGPFVTAAMAPTTGGQALAAFNGGVQVLGASLAIAGFVAQKRFVVWQDKTASLKITPNAGVAPATAGQQAAATGGITLTFTHL